MPLASVSKNAILIGSQYSGPFTIQNLSTVNVYLGGDSSLTPGNPGYVILPGGEAAWSGGSLWVCADASVTINYFQGITGGANSTVSGTVSIAGGTVSTIPTGTQTVAGNVGAQLASLPVLLYTYSFQTPNAGNQTIGYPSGAPYIDMLGFTEAVVELVVNVNTSSNFAPEGTNFHSLTITQSNGITGAGGGIVDSCQFLHTQSKEYSYNIPLLKRYLNVAGLYNAGNVVTPSACTVTLNVYGVSSPSPAKLYTHDFVWSNGGGAGVSVPTLSQDGMWQGSVTATSGNATIAPYICSKTGALTLQVLSGNDNSVATLDLLAWKNGVSYQLSRAEVRQLTASLTNANPPSSNQFVTVHSPSLPLQVNLRTILLSGSSSSAMGFLSLG